MSGTVQYPAQIIDMHTHMFNAYYLPLKSIFVSWGIPKGVSGTLARLSNGITRISKFPHLERARIFKNATEFAQFSNKDHDALELVEKYVEALAHDAVTLYRETLPFISEEKFDQTDADVLWQVRLNAELRSIFEDIQNEHGNKDSQKILEMTPTEARLLSDFSEKSDKSIKWLGLWRSVRKFILYALSWVESAGDTVDFLYNLTKNERKIFRRLDRYYSDRNVTCTMVHHMMDMKWAYDAGNVRLEHYPSTSSPRSQLSQMRGLQNSSGGRLLGFAGFDPHRFVKSGATKDQIIAHLEQALGYGMLGFKFYPPLDYRPADNREKVYEDVVDIFLDYCTNNNVPVFTHCTPVGFEKAKGTGENAHPKFWRTALEKKQPKVKSDRTKLRLCFGHAGGGIFSLKEGKSYGWISKSELKWARDTNYAYHVVELCRKYENVYCEIAHITELLKVGSHRAEFEYRLAKECMTPRLNETTYALADKIMYGTDWHMREMVNDVDDYFDYIVSIFSKLPLKPYASKFFSENAKNYLQLKNLNAPDSHHSA